MDKLPGNCCSKPERHGGLGEEGSWIGLGCFNHRLSTFLRPDFGEVFQEGLAEYRAAAERSATRPHTTIHMFGCLKCHFFCFLLFNQRLIADADRKIGQFRSAHQTTSCGRRKEAKALLEELQQ